MLKAIDLFAGAGGFSCGFEKAGFKITKAVEFNSEIAKTYEYNHPYTKGGFTDLVGPYLAAAGHFGKCSRQLVRHYAEDLGFVYLSAENKKEYLVQLVRFLESGLTERPILFEVFTDPAEESAALKTLRNLPVSW